MQTARFIFYSGLGLAMIAAPVQGANLRNVTLGLTRTNGAASIF